MTHLIHAFAVAAVLLIAAGTTVSYAGTGDEFRDELIRYGTIVHPGGILAGR